MIIEEAPRRHGPKSEYFGDIYVSDHDGEFVSMEEAHKELAAKDAEIARLMDKLAKCGFDIGVLTERLAHREKSHAATVEKVIILKKCLSQFVSKVKQYEMDVDAERPIEHRELMVKAAQLIHN